MKLECRRGISPAPLDMRGVFSSFSPFFKSPGAGVTGSPGSIISAIFIPLLIWCQCTSTGEIDNQKSCEG